MKINFRSVGDPSPEFCEYLTDSKLRFTFDNLHPINRGSGLEAFIEVYWTGKNACFLHGATHNIKAATMVKTLNQVVKNALATEGIDLFEVDTERAIKGMVNDVRRVHDLQHNARADNGEPLPESRWLIPGWVEFNTVTRLIAEGGSYKSLFALAMCITVATGTPKLMGKKPTQTGPALFLDWETDYTTFVEHQRALCRGINIAVPDNVRYMGMGDPLYVEKARVKAAVRDFGPIFMVLDSNAAARGGSAAGASYEDSTIQTMGVLRSIGLATAICDHKTKEAIAKKAKGGYGSGFNTNLSRLEFEWDGIERTEDGAKVKIKLMKSNNIKVGREDAFRFGITTNGTDRWDTARIEPIHPDEVQQPGGGPDQSHADRIELFLMMQTEAKTVAQITEGCGYEDNQQGTVRTTLNRYVALFENIATGGPGLWRLRGASTDEGREQPLIDPF